MTSAIAKYLVTSMRPIAEIENEGFVDLLASLVPTYQPPCRKVLHSAIVEKCHGVFNRLRAESRDVTYCAGQADIWSRRRMHGYFGMAVSYISSCQLKTRAIACKRFQGSHTGERIANTFSALINDFDIKHKISGLVTDNAANMIKAFKLQTELVAHTSTEHTQEEGEDEELVRVGLEWKTV